MVNTATLTKPTLRRGDSGAAVKELQSLLNNYSQYISSRAIAPGAIDGQFGPITQLAVLAFQEQVFLPKTGVAADLTWRSLFKRAPVDLPNVEFGDTSDFVTILEQRLIRLRFLTGPADRRYEQRTVAAVSAFQRSVGLPQRSTVDEAMWFALSKIAIA